MDPERATELLERERSRINRELAELRADRGTGNDELSGVDQHTADAGTELFEQERDTSLIERLERDLEAVERAFKRLAEGKYGVSVDSGKPIPDQRLEAVPWAERTVEEQGPYDAQQRNAG